MDGRISTFEFSILDLGIFDFWIFDFKCFLWLWGFLNFQRKANSLKTKKRYSNTVVIIRAAVTARTRTPPVATNRSSRCCMDRGSCVCCCSRSRGRGTRPPWQPHHRYYLQSLQIIMILTLKFTLMHSLRVIICLKRILQFYRKHIFSCTISWFFLGNLRIN